VLSQPSVAVVGARSCSSYGAQVARDLARELAAAGVVVVSGMARGIDGEAHRGALEAGGVTVAVLGCGIDRDYPRSHADLADRIRQNGAVVSEYPPGVEPAPWRFPARNRIIAGLGLATVVVEARERSGALITADFALELGRDVFAVPGEITTALSAGTNDLLRQGAAPLLSAEDVFFALGMEASTPVVAAKISESAQAVFRLLADGALGADELARRGKLPTAEVATALVELELAGLVTAAEGVYRCRSERPVLAR
jgi:DNA processing protein